MPALIVSQVISSAFGFSRKRWMLPLRVGLDQPVGARVLDRRQHDGRLRLALAVQRDDRAEIDLRQHVAVEHDHRFAQRFAGVAHRAAGAERRRLDDVADAEAGIAAVAEDLLDPPRLVVEAEDRLRRSPAPASAGRAGSGETAGRRSGRSVSACESSAGAGACLCPPRAGSPSCATTDVIMWRTRAHEPAELADGHAHLPRAAARGRAADEVRGPADSRRAEGVRRRRDFRRWPRSPTGPTATWRAAASRSRRSDSSSIRSPTSC